MKFKKKLPKPIVIPYCKPNRKSGAHDFRREWYVVSPLIYEPYLQCTMCGLMLMEEEPLDYGVGEGVIIDSMLHD